MQKQSIVLHCAPYAAPVLAKELEQLGFPVLEQNPLSVTTSGTFEDCWWLNLHLRTANRVLYPLKSFRIQNADMLYKVVSQFPWEKWIPRDGYYSIHSHVRNDSIRDNQFANLRMKDAIADRFMRLYDERPNSGSNRDGSLFYLHWVKDEAVIYADTSGETIAKHNYRKKPFKAPLLESLAATILLLTEWDGKAPLLNPMCGSGTLAIEAALIAQHKVPGLLREDFGFMHLLPYDETKWLAMKEKAAERVEENPSCQIIATDISEMALEAARSNAKWAGVDHLIEFKKCDFRDTPVPEEEGVIIFNPEYGERLGEEKQLEGIYKAIGDFLKQHCAGYKGFVFTGNPALGKKIGLRPDRKIPLMNGKIECRLLTFSLYKGTKRNV